MFIFKLRIIYVIYVTLKWLYTVYNISVPPHVYLSLVFKLLNISSQTRNISGSVGSRQPKNRSCLGVSRMTGGCCDTLPSQDFFSNHPKKIQGNLRKLGSLTSGKIFFTLLFFSSC